MFLIVGLGNPGAKYEDTRHNAGFLCVDELHKAYNFPPFVEKYKAHFSKGKIDGHDVCLLKPQTFMNLSGKSVAAFLQFFKLPLENVFVIHDDLDLDPGRLRVKHGGGHGGHNGLKSLDACIGKNYGRIRLGIGRSPFKGDTSNYVLGTFSKEERQIMDQSCEKISDALPELLKDPLSPARFQNMFYK